MYSEATNAILNFADRLDKFVLRIGGVVSWLCVLLILIICLHVLLRYGLGMVKAVLEELMWHIYAVGFLIGFSYASVTDSHVRVDLLSTRLTARSREWFEIFGIMFLLLPFIIVILGHSYHFVYNSWMHNERSMAPVGLPYRWLIKSFIPIGFGLWGLSAISRVLRAIGKLTGGDEHAPR